MENAGKVGIFSEKPRVLLDLRLSVAPISLDAALHLRLQKGIQQSEMNSFVRILTTYERLFATS